MAVQNETMMLKAEKDQSLSKQNVQENLSEMQEFPRIAPPITYELLEETETEEAEVYQDMIDNPELWKSMTNREVLQRIAAIHRRVEAENTELNIMIKLNNAT